MAKMKRPANWVTMTAKQRQEWLKKREAAEKKDVDAYKAGKGVPTAITPPREEYPSAPPPAEEPDQGDDDQVVVALGQTSDQVAGEQYPDDTEHVEIVLRVGGEIKEECTLGEAFGHILKKFGEWLAGEQGS